MAEDKKVEEPAEKPEPIVKKDLWTLITGASSGIGYSYARRLARQGYSLVLVARRQERLESLANDLKVQHGTISKVIVADLATDTGIKKVERAIAKGPTIDMLINNAGFGTQGNFVDVDLKKHLDMLHVHINATVRLTYAALPAMIEQKNGVIINVSSMGAFMASPGGAIYNPTKSFLNMFSEIIQKENIDNGITVQALCPGFTHTNFHEVGDFEGFDRSVVDDQYWMSAEAVVDESLQALDKGKVVLVPGSKNRMFITAFQNPATRPLAIYMAKRAGKRSRDGK